MATLMAEAAHFHEGVNDSKDLVEGLIFEAIVTNDAAFGAFVNIGAHQVGMVHISQLAQKFVKAPWDVVKAADIVKVNALEVDVQRKRIAMTMRLDAPTAPPGNALQRSKPHGPNAPRNRMPPTARLTAPASASAIAAAFASLKK
jgi:protein Tex